MELRLATIGNQNNPDRAAKSRRLILEHYQIGPGEYRACMDSIISRPDMWQEFQNKAIQRITELQKIHKGD